MGLKPFATASRTKLWPTQPPIQWVTGDLTSGLSGQDVKLTTHIQPVPRSRIHGAISPLPRCLHGVVL